MEIKLNWLKIKNFKGIRDFLFEPNGQNTFVFADNGKGKTTLMDTFLWLLFDKDSTDRTAFKIKPQGENGQDIHNLQIVVEAELLIDDSNKILVKKMQEEKWTKKRGSETSELTGNTVSYWWNEVPVKAGEFKSKINELVDEGIFKRITNPLYFNTKLEWQERRKTVIEMSGDMTDEQVIEADRNLLKLKEILNGRSVDDYKKVIADKLKDLKKEHDDIPPRIDELTYSLPQNDIDYSDIESQLEEHKKTMNGIELLMTNQSKKADEIAKRYSELGRLNNDLENVKRKIEEDFYKERNSLLQEKSEHELGVCTLEANIQVLKSEIESSKIKIERNTKTREQLLTDWKDYSEKKTAQVARQFIEPSEDDFSCPACGQKLPTDATESKIKELRDNFEKEKNKEIAFFNKKLEENKADGLKLKTDTETANEKIKENQEEIARKEEALNKLQSRITEIQKKLDEPVETISFTTFPEYIDLDTKITKLQEELNKPTEDKSSILLSQKANIQEKADECNSVLNSRAEIEKKKARINELKAEEKRIAGKIAELEGHKYLLEKFTVSKVNLLEDKINSNFKFVKFRLFNVQQNGGIAETCEALVNTNGRWVPFADANAAGCMNAGLDIINSLNTFYDVYAPIWFDNRENVSKLIDTDNQIINLIKPPTWDELDKIAQEALRKAGVTKDYWNKRNETLRVEREEK